MTPAVFENAFAGAVSPAEVEDDPFGSVAVAEPEPIAVAEDDPFAADVVAHDSGAERAEMQVLLAGARRIVESLEAALEAARAHEHALEQKLDEL
jgi:hypothetical protein